ncbi:MAG: hypothetical protein ACFE0P_16300 [Oceanicaulis sp.]
MLMLAAALSLQAAACTPPEGHDSVSAHLEAIREADQADRRNRIDPLVMRENDQARRAHVDAYLAGGCLATGRDHHNAALIHQHGGAPEDYRTAFELAVRAVELGDEEASWLIPRAIDRYFMNQGYKQLYATNSRGFPREDGEGFVMCLWPSVAEISDSDRQALGVRTQAEQRAWVAEMNGEEEGRICEAEAEDPPRGVFDGYW